MSYFSKRSANIFSDLEDHISLLFTFLDQINLIQQKNPFEHFLNTNSNEILNCWFLSKINFDKLSLSNIIINKNLYDIVSGYLCKKRECNQDNGKCVECIDGYYKDKENECKSCPSNCSTCGSEENCYSCNDGFYGNKYTKNM